MLEKERQVCHTAMTINRNEGTLLRHSSALDLELPFGKVQCLPNLLVSERLDPFLYISNLVTIDT
jgi:hypothetical protein